MAAKKKPRKKQAKSKRTAVRKATAKGGTRSRKARDLTSGRESGDLQGLSRVPTADSESVEELMEEGNALEGDVVSGVEDADRAEGKEVRTHEVPEDDVPSEYLDEE